MILLSQAAMPSSLPESHVHVRRLVLLPASLLRASLLRAILVSAVVLATGCQSGPIHRADALPPQLMAPRFANAQSVDLSRFSQSLGDSELLYPGDVVAVTIATGLETEEPTAWKGRIAEDGSVNVPLVGVIQLAGLKLPQAEQAVRYESVQRGKFVNPNVTVKIDSRRSNTITVIGAVKKPGTYELPASDSHVLAAISRAEGLLDEADTVIEIRHPGLASAGPMVQGGPPGTGPGMGLVGFPRGGPGAGLPPRTMRIDLEQAAQLGQADMHLEDGSAVMVMRRPKRYVHVIGLVRRPDQFEIPPDQELRLLDAIAMANGRTLELADKVRVIRTLPHQTEPAIIEASVREAKLNTNQNIRLAPGDIVSVEETPLTFVVGTIREFVRFGFTAGIPGI